MAIAFDSSNGSGAGWAVNNTTYTWQHTIGTGNFLIVFVWNYNPSLVTVSSLTYAGVAMTKLASITANLESNFQDFECWYLSSPAAGLNNVSITWSGNAQFSNGYSLSYSGVNSISPIDSHAIAQNLTAVSSYSLATTVVASNCWLTGFVYGRATSGTLAAGAGTTLRKSDTSNAGGQSGDGDSNATVGTGSHALAWSWANAGTVPGAITVSLAPPGAPKIHVSQALAAVLGQGGSRIHVSQVVGSILCLNVGAPGSIPPCPIPMFPDVATTTGNASVVATRGWSVKRTLRFASLVQTAFSGRESISPQQLYSAWQFDLQYDVLHDQTQNQSAYSPYAGSKDFQKITQLFNWASGTRGSFYFEDPEDNSRTGQVIVASGDGTTTTFTIGRTINPSGGSSSFTEPVGAVNLKRPVNLYVNGFLQAPSAYTIVGNQLTFGPVPVGETLTMDFWFYYLCHFSEDQMQPEEFMKNLWRLGKCRFESLISDPCMGSLGVNTEGTDQQYTAGPTPTFGSGVSNEYFDGRFGSNLQVSSNGITTYTNYTTNTANCVIVLGLCFCNGTTSPPTVVSVSDDHGLVWAKRTAVTFGQTRLELWWAPCASGSITNGHISVFINQGNSTVKSLQGNYYTGCSLIAVVNGLQNYLAPWDSGGTVPIDYTNTGIPPTGAISTINNPALVISLIGDDDHGNTWTGPTGWTTLGSGDQSVAGGYATHIDGFYLSVGSSGTGSLNYGGSSSNDQIIIGDSLVLA